MEPARLTSCPDRNNAENIVPWLHLAGIAFLDCLPTRLICVIATGAILSIGCTPWVRPDAPPEGIAPAWPALESSSIMLPISIPLESLRAAVESEIPTQWAEWDAWIVDNGWCAAYRVSRDPLSLSFENSTLHLSVPAHVWVKGGAYVRGCRVIGSCDAAATLPVSAKIEIDRAWRLNVKLSNGGIGINNCKVTFLGININGRIADKANPAIDRALRLAEGRISTASDFRSKGEDLWIKLQTPQEVSPGLWLTVNPSDVLASPLTSSGPDLNTAVGLVAHPVLTTARPGSTPPPPLPDLSIRAPSDAFHIAIDGVVGYAAATEKTSAAILGRRYPFKVANKEYALTVKGVRVYGAGNLAVVRLDIDGSARGTVYLTGRPRYDSASEAVSVENLDYSIETRNVLVKVADWLLHADFQKKIAAEAQWRLTQSLDKVKAQVEGALNRKVGKATLEGHLNGMRVLGVRTDPQGFFVRAVADGTVRARAQ